MFFDNATSTPELQKKTPRPHAPEGTEGETPLSLISVAKDRLER